MLAGADPNDYSPFLALVLGSFAVACSIFFIFATDKWHHWRFGVFSSRKEREFDRLPLNFLKETMPWWVRVGTSCVLRGKRCWHCAACRAAINALFKFTASLLRVHSLTLHRFANQPRASSLVVDANFKLLKWSKTRDKVQCHKRRAFVLVLC